MLNIVLPFSRRECTARLNASLTANHNVKNRVLLYERQGFCSLLSENVLFWNLHCSKICIINHWWGKASIKNSYHMPTLPSLPFASTYLCLNVPSHPVSLGSASSVFTEPLTAEKVVPESPSVLFLTAKLKVSEYRSRPTSSWMSLRSFLPNVTQATKQKKLYKH